MTTLEQVERAIAELQPSVRAEKEYGPGKRNPWAGSSEKLAVLEKQRDELRAQVARARVQSALDAHERARKALADASAAYAKAIRERTQLDNSTIIMRYRNAPEIARRYANAQRFENWKLWFESNRREVEMRPDERPNQGGTHLFAEACRFNANDRKVVHQWLRARDAETMAMHAKQAAERALSALECEHPELRAAKVA